MKKLIIIFIVLFLCSFVQAKTVRVLYNLDGSVSVIHVSKYDTQDELKTSFDKATPEGIEYEDIDSSELPENRADRNFWKKTKGNQFTIDTAAKEKANQKALIKAEKEELIEQQAIESLKTKGQLPNDYKK